jgi:hypothetical protein
MKPRGGPRQGLPPEAPLHRCMIHTKGLLPENLLLGRQAASLLGLATRSAALPMQLDEISNAGLSGPIPPRRRVPPFGVGLNSYTAPLLVSVTDRFKLFQL